MNNDLRRPPNDPIRKAAFREQARGLVLIDRQTRKAKKVVDTAGMIASALDRAYKLGYEDAQREGETWIRTVGEGEDALEWITIPSRARRVFESFAYSLLGQHGDLEGNTYYVPALTERGTQGWSRSWPGRVSNSSTLEEAKGVVADQTMAILLRLGLVEFSECGRQKIIISQRGRNTWARHCAGAAD